MMNLAKKIAKIFSVIFFAFLVASCDSGCVEADQFDGNYVTINSNPGSSAITGTYDGSTDANGDVTGGQQVTWTDTALKSNGEQFIIQITGGWLPWYGNAVTGSSFDNLERCNFCARKDNVGNCLCYRNQVSEPEISSDGYTKVTGVDCSGDAQDNREKCTCTKKYGVATAYTAYHIPLNYGDKNGNPISPEDQTVCKYDSGMGLYLGLFGRSGNETPIRVYHLFTEDSVCDVPLNSDGECKDKNGKDVTKYMFKSANDTIFVKDDNNNNNKDDDYFKNGATLHTANEHVKLIIYDSYYLDNNGGYNVNFFKGVGKSKDAGLLEYLVSLVEDTVLGKIDPSTCVEIDAANHKKRCQREGGIIRYMYLSIVQDSVFITVLQILLSMYIAFYGLATLLGLAAITKKELTTRVLKIGLIIFFTSPTSWSFYNDIIVAFFKDSMDYVIGLFMDISDGNLNDENSSIIIAQMERATDTSNATRFSFIDLTIKKLLSFAAAKKIFGLFFGSYFGIIYIVAIYALISYFIYVVLLAATFYLINMMKIVFVLALGPVFMCFSLFAQTNPIFKRWVSYLGSRSLEILFLFIFLYNFIVIIDREFVSLLYYRACVEMWGIPFIKTPIIKSYIDRSLISWCTDIVTIGGLIFIMQMVVNQIPAICGNLITIGGDANKDGDGVGRGQSSMNLANKIMGGSGDEYGVYDVAKIARQSTIGGLKFGAGVLAQGGTGAYRAAVNSSVGKAIASSSLGKAIGKINDILPNSPRTMYRNKIIDTAIKAAQAEAKSKGLTGVKADAYVRSSALSKLQSKMYRNYSANKSDGPKAYDPTGMKLAGVDMASIVKRFDEVLVKEPLKKMIAEESKKMNSSSNPLFGAEREERLRQIALQWGENTLSGGKGAVQEHLGKLDGFIKKQSAATTSEVAKAALDNEAVASGYLRSLKDNEISLNQEIEKNKTRPFGVRHVRGAARRFAEIFNRNDKNNPAKQREILLRKLAKRRRMEAKTKELNELTGWDRITKGIDLGHIRDRLTGDLVFGRWFDGKNVAQIDTEAQLKNLRDSVGDRTNIIERDKKAVKEDYDKRMKESNKYKKDIEDKIKSFEAKIEKDEDNKRKLAQEKEELEKKFKESSFITGNRQEQLKYIHTLEKKIAEISKNQEYIKKEKEVFDAEFKRLSEVTKAFEDGRKKEEVAVEEGEKLINERKDSYKKQMEEVIRKDIEDKLKEKGVKANVLLEEAEKRLRDANKALIIKRLEEFEKAEEIFKPVEKILEDAKKSLADVEKTLAEKKSEFEKLKAEDSEKAKKEIEDIRKTLEEKRLKVAEAEKKVEEPRRIFKEAEEILNDANLGSNKMTREGNIILKVERVVKLPDGKDETVETTLFEEKIRVDYLKEVIARNSNGGQADIIIKGEEEGEDLQLEETINESEEKHTENVLKESESKLGKLAAEKSDVKAVLSKIIKAEIKDVEKEVKIIAEVIAEKNGQGVVDRANADYEKYLEMSAEDLKKSFDLMMKVLEIEQKEFSTNGVYEIQKAKMALVQAEKKYINFRKNSKNNGESEAEEEAIQDEILTARDNLFIARQELLINQKQSLDFAMDNMSSAESVINQAIAEGSSLEEAELKLQGINDFVSEFEKNKSLADVSFEESKRDKSDKKLEKSDIDSSDKTVLKDSYNIDKGLSLSKARLAKLNLSVKKEELKALRLKDEASLTASDRIKISALENDIASLERESERYTSEVRDIEVKIDGLNS